MLRHQKCCRVYTDGQLGEVGRCYPLNYHAMALLGIGPEFRESVDKDIQSDEENMRTISNLESDLEEEIESAQAGDEADMDDAMED